VIEVPAASHDRDSAEPPPPIDVCDELMLVNVLNERLGRVDLTEAQKAMQACFGLVVTRLPPVYRSLLTRRDKLARPLGYGIEEKVIASCAEPDGALAKTLGQFGICRKFEMAETILTCAGRGLAGPLGESTGHGPCALGDEIRKHHADGSRAQWLSVAHDALPAGIMRDRHGRGVPVEFDDALRVMDYFADQAADSTGWDEKATKPYDVQVVGSFLSERGVRLTNLTEGSSQTTAKPAVLREIAARHGSIYETLAHLGFIYSKAYPQYSGSKLIPPSATELVVEMSDWYRIIFSRQDGAWLLSAIEYYEHGC
jgi:hypothetical protein